MATEQSGRQRRARARRSPESGAGVGASEPGAEAGAGAGAEAVPEPGAGPAPAPALVPAPAAAHVPPAALGPEAGPAPAPAPDDAERVPSRPTVTIKPVDGGLTSDGNSWWDDTHKQWRRVPNKVGDHGAYQAVVAALIGVAFVVLVGATVAVFVGKSLPGALIAIGASAVTGLVGLLVPSPLSRGGAGGNSQPGGGPGQPKP